MLQVRDLQAGYGKAEVLHGISLDLPKGEVMALLGRNGMGKSTTLNTIMGVLTARGGAVSIDGKAVTGARPSAVARLGVGYVPEGRRVFPNLTLRENLVAVSRASAKGPWGVEAVTDLFPALAPRFESMGNVLSGGEQQMLAIGRALMTNPRLLILDEATEGLAPVVRKAIWSALTRLAGEGLTILVVDKNLDRLLSLSNRVVVLERGRVAWSGDRSEARADRRDIEALMSVQ